MAQRERISEAKSPSPWSVAGVIGFLLRVLLLASSLSFMPAGAQSSTYSVLLSGQSTQSGTWGSQDELGGSSSGDSMRRDMREKQNLELRKQRYRQMVADTEELLKLATELNAEVSDSKANALTGDQLRTVARIEKLARNIKQGMAMPTPAEPALPGSSITVP